MATKKKTTPKKTVKAPAKKRTVRAKKVAAMRSFRVSKPETPFFTLSFTRQSLYWLVIGVITIVFTLWILKLQSDIEAIYDSIEQVTLESSMIPEPTKKKD